MIIISFEGISTLGLIKIEELISVSNFGPQVEYKGEGLEIVVDSDLDPDEKLSRITEKFSLPLTFRLGVKNDIIGPNSEFINMGDMHKLTFAMDGINALDYTVYGTMGLEYTWNNMASVRMGTHLGHDTAGMSFGFCFLTSRSEYAV